VLEQWYFFFKSNIQQIDLPVTVINTKSRMKDVNQNPAVAIMAKRANPTPVWVA
jgi:hypothetical protein